MELNISNEDYHNWGGLSKSSLAVIDRSPAHFKANMETKNEPTPAMRRGTIVHTMVLEPQEFFNRYVYSPKFDLRKKQGKEDKLKFEEDNKGKEAITEEEWYMAVCCLESVLDHPSASVLFAKKGVAESSFFWEKDGVTMRCRPDWLADNGDETFDIVDLKTATDASPWAFKYSVTKFKYDLQEAIYREGVGKELTVRNFYFVAIEPFPPYAVGVYMLDSRALDYSKTKYQALIDLYNECMFLDEWPAYSNDIETLELKRWE